MALRAHCCPSVVVAALLLAVHTPPSTAIALGQVGDLERALPGIDASDDRPEVVSLRGASHSPPELGAQTHALDDDPRTVGRSGTDVGDPDSAPRSKHDLTARSRDAAQEKARIAPARMSADPVAAVPRPHVLVLLAAGLGAVVMRREMGRRGPRA